MSAGARFALGIFLCLLIVGQAASFDFKGIFSSITDYITNQLGKDIKSLFTASKTLAVCGGKVFKCGLNSVLDDSDSVDPCESVRDAGHCVFNNCPEIGGTEDENKVIEFLNGLMRRVPNCELTREELKGSNHGNQHVSRPFCFVSCLVLGAVILRKLVG